MKQLLLTTAFAIAAAALSAPTVQAQSASSTVAEDRRPSGAQAFTPENAILNTAILFAVGAREAQQSLRNAFGWPTFQEGLVQGVYYRFDPDGYARFSPSPRLDADVFEVICRPRTFTCLARKGPLTLTLTSDGRVQMAIDQVLATDTFALNDGFSELQIPPRVNGLLDPQMITLLSSGGSLIVNRNGEVVEDVSLQGFAAVHAYLLWVAARQDYSVLPRDWPVPNGLDPAPLQNAQTGNWPNVGLRSAPVLQTNTAAQIDQINSGTQESSEVAALRSEVALLRDLLIAQTGGAANGPMPTLVAENSARTVVGSVDQSDLSHSNPQDGVLIELDNLRHNLGLAPAVPAIAEDMEPASTAFGTETLASAQPSQGISDAVVMDAPISSEQHPSAEIKHLHYLTSKMGLDARTALLILQLSQAVVTESGSVAESAPVFQPSASDSIFEQLNTALNGSGQESSQVAAEIETENEYALLASYFQSVFVEDTQ